MGAAMRLDDQQDDRIQGGPADGRNIGLTRRKSLPLVWRVSRHGKLYEEREKKGEGNTDGDG